MTRKILHLTQRKRTQEKKYGRKVFVHTSLIVSFPVSCIHLRVTLPIDSFSDALVKFYLFFKGMQISFTKVIFVNLYVCLYMYLVYNCCGSL